MYCKNCGSEIAGAGVFCQSCGEKIEVDATSDKAFRQPAYEKSAPPSHRVPDSKLPFVAGILVLGCFLNQLIGTVVNFVSFPSDIPSNFRLNTLMWNTIYIVPTLILLIMLALSVPKRKAGLLIIPLSLMTLLGVASGYGAFSAMQISPGGYASGYYYQYQLVVSIVTGLLYIVLLIAFCLAVARRVNVTKPLVVCSFIAFCVGLAPRIYEWFLAKYAYEMTVSTSSESYIFIYFVALLCLSLYVSKDEKETIIADRADF